ncbi:FtsK/SpoIIIE domain-containing protein [Thermoactinospora rubra]|uniref:FtsK/SpoIIIE domain-containing protein n=1 Tax=Thermoactinospora rubra TaxID=1088767 RepID=UPI000A0FF466|nr:FtsK/SpoIIIE domain-containing protein [Thermoactinospora rubra]
MSDDLPRLRVVRGDHARGPGDEPAPEKVLHTDTAGRAELALPEEYDAETVEDGDEVVTDRPVDIDDGDEPVLYGKVVTRHDTARAPIVPLWLRSAREARQVLAHELDLAWYRLRKHAWNSPKYLLRILRWAPVGLARTLGAFWRWAWCSEQAPLRRQLAQPGGDVAAYLKLEELRAERVRIRLPIFAATIVACAGGTAAAITLAPRGWLLLAGLAVAAVLARVGRPVDRPIVEVAVTIERKRRLTALEVREALCTLGIPGLKDPAKVNFPVEIHRDGPGQLARVNLPRGIEAVEVCERRGKLSSALRRPVDQVWPKGGPDHAGQLDLWVGYKPVSQMTPPRWSLLRDGARTSVFEPIEFGTDQRQNPISAPLFELNWLIGGRPGSGKSYFARAVALGAALDPTAEFMIAEFKGTGDFMDFDEAGLCSSYVCGVDDEAFDEAADMLGWLLAECGRRGKRIKRYRAQGRAPQGKATPELAAEPGSGLHPIVVVFDEVHELFGARSAAADAAERIIKRGRALNIIVILATQIPDKDSLPKNITRCAAMRACLAVDDYIANDMILGTGAHKRGVTATQFRPKIDAGWAMVTGLEEPTAVRAAFPTEAEGRALLARAVQLRGGVLPGRDEELPKLDILVDVERVWPAGRGGLQWPQLAELLRLHRPELYGEDTAETISARLRRLDVPSVDVKADGKTLKGCRREAVEEALRRRELGHG